MKTFKNVIPSLALFVVLFSPILCYPATPRAKRSTRECEPALDIAPHAVRDDGMNRPSCTKTLIVVILDESGSMGVQKKDVIGGYNSFIDNQKDVKGDEARLILIKFSTTVSIAHGAIELREVPHLNAQSYRPGGGTALYDAVSEGILIAEGAAKGDERILVLIMTDGEENSSKKATSSAVKSMIQRKESLGMWTFAYIGANPEAWASSMGQTQYNVREYNLEDQGSNMDKANDAVMRYRGAAAPQSKAFFKQ